MKNFKILYLIILCVSIVNCKKETTQRDDVDDDDTTVFVNPYIYTTPPCTPDSNSCYYNGFKLDFGNSSIWNNPYYLSTGWKMEGSTYPGGGFSLEFRAKPKTQKYVTTYYTDITTDNQVHVYGTFGLGMSHHYNAASGDTVYVKLIDAANDIYSVDFCDLEFSTSDPSIPPFRTDGNLTTN